MMRSRWVHAIVAALVCGALSSAPATAEDTKGKWQFGFGISYYSTVDFIRSNSDVAISSGLAGEDGLPSVVFTDPRPDNNMLNEPSVRDDFKLDFNASYGLTRWLAVELAASYLKAPVGNIEVYTEDVTKIVGAGFGTDPAHNFCGRDQNLRCFNYNDPAPSGQTFNNFLPVGQITEIPLQLSGLVRFRPESPFDPYIGLGLGYIFTDLKQDDRFVAQARTVSELLVQKPILGNAVKDPSFPDIQPPGITPGPLTAEVSDAFEWHAIGGVDYYLSERFSMFVDARYVWTSGAVDIRIWDSEQAILPSTELGKLRVSRDALDGVLDWRVDAEGNRVRDTDLYNLWEDRGTAVNAAFHTRCSKANGASSDCKNSGLFETDDKNGNGLYDAGEDDGTLLQLPPGSFDPGEHISTISCPACANRGRGPAYGASTTLFQPANTEDTNFTRTLDRFLLFGVDCASVDAADFPACAGIARTLPNPQFVWPEGCDLEPPQRPRNASVLLLQEGCPAPRKPLGAVHQTSADNVQDKHLIQGGSIRLGGFSLGVGVKFTF